VKDDDQAVMHLLNGFDGPAEQAWPRDTSAADSAPSAFATELVSLRFVGAALRRGARLWCTFALIGLLLGVGYKLKHPTPYQASTTVLLPQDENSDGAILTDVGLAQSRAVASLALHTLGSTQSVTSFVNTYLVTNLTNEVLEITATGTSAQSAVNSANAVANGFLQFRANLQLAEQKIAVSALKLQVRAVEKQINALTARISGLSGGSNSPGRQAQLASLQSQLGQANSALTAANASIQSTEQQTILQNRESKVLDGAVSLPRSRKKPMLVSAGIGFFVGLMLAIAILIVRAVVSDRLRQRDDVAYALGAPVSVSVGPVRLNRWMPGQPDLAAPRSKPVRAVVAHLRAAIPMDSRTPAALAVVAVDDPRAAALCVASLATSCAREGLQVVMADLTGGVASRLLGVRGSGVVTTGERGSRLVMVVPDASDPAPVGPWPRGGSRTTGAPVAEVTAACKGSDLVLAVATLDPALGADHLATWAPDAVAMVTAGQSSWTKIHAAGEMVRLAHVRLTSAVLIGADKSDESIGMPFPAAVSQRSEIPPQAVADPYQG